MDEKTFAQKLGEIENEAGRKIFDLVNTAQADEGLSWDTNKAVSFHNNPNWNYRADALAEMTGWIYDRLNGKNRQDKKSMTKKIRKALGYSRP